MKHPLCLQQPFRVVYRAWAPLSSFPMAKWKKTCHWSYLLRNTVSNPDFFQVEIWLNHVLAHMKATVRHEMTESVTTYDEKPREQWIFDYPAQVFSQPGPLWNPVLYSAVYSGNLQSSGATRHHTHYLLHSQERLVCEGSARGSKRIVSYDLIQL